jgi:hypothetical protein
MVYGGELISTGNHRDEYPITTIWNLIKINVSDINRKFATETRGQETSLHLHDTVG